MMNIKKKIMVIFATGIMAFSALPFVLAATPAPANNTQQAEQVDTTKQDNRQIKITTSQSKYTGTNSGSRKCTDSNGQFNTNFK